MKEREAIKILRGDFSDVLSVDPCLIDRTYNTEDCIDGYCKLCKEKYWSQEME